MENVKEKLLFCGPLKDHTRGKDIPQKVDKFLKIEGLKMEKLLLSRQR